jgi:hypothetical protein
MNQLQAIAVLPAWHLLSRAAINNSILATGILLQAGLVFVAFRRGIASRFPVFTALLIFYPLRAGLLFALGGYIDPDNYDSLFNALGVVEILLQAAVAIELLLRLMRELGGWTVRRAVVASLCAAAACGLTWAVLSRVAEKELEDRVQVLAWFVMLALFVAIVKSSRWRNLRCIAAGFAGFSVIQLAALAGRNYAMMRHQNAAYVGWSYVPACGYLLVVLFWMVGLRRESSTS